MVITLFALSLVRKPMSLVRNYKVVENNTYKATKTVDRTPDRRRDTNRLISSQVHQKKEPLLELERTRVNGKLRNCLIDGSVNDRAESAHTYTLC